MNRYKFSKGGGGFAECVQDNRTETALTVEQTTKRLNDQDDYIKLLIATLERKKGDLDDAMAVDEKWIDEIGKLTNGLIEVRTISNVRKFDAVEIWQANLYEKNSDAAILAISRFPITRGDIRRLCKVLGIWSRSESL